MPEKYKTTSVGIDMTGVRTVLDNSDNDGNGEICMNGRHVFMGYLDMEKQTKDTIDERGLLHTGDVGRKDSEGFLFITGRIKGFLIKALLFYLFSFVYLIVYNLLPYYRVDNHGWRRECGAYTY